MTSDDPVDIEALDAALAGAAPKLSDAEQRLAATIYRSVAKGRPATVEAAALQSGLAGGVVEETLRAWPGVFRDSDGAIVGFWGLALHEMPPHRLRAGDVSLYAWCAWDPLFLAQIVGPLEVATEDPVTRSPITYRIGEDGAIDSLSHPGAVLSFLRPDQPWGQDVITTFCHYVLLFADADSATRWCADHPGTFVISLDDGIQLARRFVRRMTGNALMASTSHANGSALVTSPHRGAANTSPTMRST